MASYREMTGIVSALLRAIRGGNMSSSGVLLDKASKLLDEAKRNLRGESPWTPFEAAVVLASRNRNLVRRTAEIGNMTEADAERFIADRIAETELFVNSRYQVAVDRNVGGGMVHLSIKQIDQGQLRNWRDLQRIKSELIGAECEGVEIYPAESRMVDTSNQYHLWVQSDPTKRLPFGLGNMRLVTDDIDAGEGQTPIDKS